MSGPFFHRIRGFSLIEVMISLVVVSLGLGGIMMAQGRSAIRTHSAGYQLQASLLAQSILDTARANPNQSYDSTSASGTAADDLAAWQTAISDALPGGTGTVTRTRLTITTATLAQNLEKLTVRISWGDRRGKTSGASVATDGSDGADLVLEGYRAIP